MTKNVLVTGTGFSQNCTQGKALLEQNGFCVLEPCTEFPRLEEAELLQTIPNIDAVVAGLDTWNDTVFAAAKRLRIVARMGIGVDNIDLQAAKARGIYVTNARASHNAVAECAMALMFCCLRKIPLLDATTRQGKWERFIGDELCGKRVGLIGFGKIAQTLAKRLRGFDCTVYAYDLAPNLAVAEALGVELLDTMDGVLRQSEIISLHLPATPDTMHVANKAFFAKCKPGAYFINTGRGALVEEAALYDALTGGQLRAAGSDVFEHEPVRPDNPLLALENFFCTPHQGAETRQTMENVGLINAQAIVDTFAGRTPQNLLNP